MCIVNESSEALPKKQAMANFFGLENLFGMIGSRLCKVILVGKKHEKWAWTG